MSLQREHHSYPITMSKIDIYKTLNNYVVQQTWNESRCGIGDIRWYDSPVLNSYEEAQSFLYGERKYRYDQLAVKYRNVSQNVKSERLKELEKKYKEANIEWGHLKNKLYVKDFKVAYIGCKVCGSKLNKDYIKSNSCPLCGYTFMTEKIKEQLYSLERKIDRIKSQIDEEKMNIMSNQKVEIMWLVSIEY